jgi:hypothetical protein
MWKCEFLARAILTVALLGASGQAYAVTIDYSAGCSIPGVDPTDCFGGIYTIDLTKVGTASGFDTYKVTMGVDTSGGLDFLDPTETGYLTNLDFKATNSEYLNPTILGGDGTWSIDAGPLNGKGCKGKNDSFVCLTALSPLLDAIGKYSVMVQFDLVEGTEVDLAHYGIRFLDEQGYGKVVSLPVPEPGSSLLLGVGALVVGHNLRRRKITGTL